MPAMHLLEQDTASLVPPSNGTAQARPYRD